MEHYTIKTNIVRYYQLQSFFVWKHYNEKYEYVVVQKKRKYISEILIQLYFWWESFNAVEFDNE